VIHAAPLGLVEGSLIWRFPWLELISGAHNK
jgi:hypothetical protein